MGKALEVRSLHRFFASTERIIQMVQSGEDPYFPKSRSQYRGFRKRYLHGAGIVATQTPGTKILRGAWGISVAGLEDHGQEPWARSGILVWWRRRGSRYRDPQLPGHSRRANWARLPGYPGAVGAGARINNCIVDLGCLPPRRLESVVLGDPTNRRKPGCRTARLEWGATATCCETIRGKWGSCGRTPFFPLPPDFRVCISLASCSCFGASGATRESGGGDEKTAPQGAAFFV